MLIKAMLNAYLLLEGTPDTFLLLEGMVDAFMLLEGTPGTFRLLEGILDVFLVPEGLLEGMHNGQQVSMSLLGIGIPGLLT